MGATAKQKAKEQKLAAARRQKATEFTPTPKRSRKASLSRKTSLPSLRPDTRSPHPMTLRDEAVYTGQHDHWTPITKLRHNQVSFVKSIATPASNEEVEAGAHRSPLAIARDSQEKEKLNNSSPGDPLEINNKGDSSLFVIDTMGASPVRTGLPDPVVRSASPTPSNSSEEVIVFKGRKTFRGHDQTRLEASTVPARAASTENISTHASLLTPQSFPLRPRDVRQSRADQLDGPISVSRNHNRSKQSYHGEDEYSDVDDEVAADYMANMRDYEDSEEDPESYFKPILTNLAHPSGFTWTSDDVQDLGDLSTSSEMVKNVACIHGRRKRPTGVQYLVVGEGLTPEVARWIQSERLTSLAAVEQIRVFEKKERETDESQIQANRGCLDSSGPSHLERVVDQTVSDENLDILERVTQAMTDEQIAARLAKQVEMGIDSDKVMLFSGHDDLSGLGRTHSRIEETIIFKTKHNRRSSQKTVGAEFPDASAFADSLRGGEQYGDFDIMDRDRASLTTKAKKKLERIEFEVSDVELEANLKSAWAKDREKKKSKKQEREDQRFMGLLGRGSDRQAREEYLKGPPLNAIKEEIKEFYMSELESLTLPPMTSSYRATVHRMCHTLSLDSCSQGAEPDRFMTIFKTSDTSPPNENRIDRLLRTFPRRPWQGTSKPGMSKKEASGAVRGNSGGTGGGAASYRDGDVVGAAAPEIGHDNKGRAMLEKMGWTKGTALGSVNNKGIMLPVAHIVKNSKAGLG